jgi:hypothetical protein
MISKPLLLKLPKNFDATEVEQATFLPKTYEESIRQMA